MIVNLRDFMKLKSQERQEDEELVTYRKRKRLIIKHFQIFGNKEIFSEADAAEKTS